MASTRSSSQETSQSGQPALRRGKACFNCRRRKMRCDGVQPVCGRCVQSDQAEDCEYTSGSEQSTCQKLERRARRLQARLQDLQTPLQLPQPLTLHQPYARSEPTTRDPSPDDQEPPLHVKTVLTDTFLIYAAQYGFFLHPGRFRDSMLYPGPVGHQLRPSPSLIFATYLLGSHFNQDQDVKLHEKSYLDSAILHLPDDFTSTTTDPSHRLHIIQAEVLLSTYFFASKRPFEGLYHANSAYSLGVVSGIQNMQTRNPSESRLPLVSDDIEEGERVNACWAIFTLDKGWAGVMGFNSSIICTVSGNVMLTTPMPREIEEYETGRYRCEQRQGYTIDSFVTGRESNGEIISSRTLLAKATFLLEKARSLSRTSLAELPSQQRAEYINKYTRFRHLAMLFKATLPPFEMWLRNRSIDFIRTAYVGITLLEVAVIFFHSIASDQGDEKAQQLSLISAHEIFTHAINLANTSWNLGFLNPIIGFAWRTAFNVLFQEFKTRNAVPSSSLSGRHQEDPLYQQLRNGLASFVKYSQCCSYINCEVQDMLDLFQATSAQKPPHDGL